MRQWLERSVRRLHLPPDTADAYSCSPDDVNSNAWMQEHGKTLHITHLAIAPAARGVGHGGRLLATVLRHADSARLTAYVEAKSSGRRRPLLLLVMSSSEGNRWVLQRVCASYWTAWMLRQHCLS